MPSTINVEDVDKLRIAHGERREDRRAGASA
jgi:hypothetical protein